MGDGSKKAMELNESTEAIEWQASNFKEEGDDMMKSNDPRAAVEKYSKAIDLFGTPDVFCSRAAAYHNLEQYDLAVQDCQAALALDQNYGEAYSRMGLALSARAAQMHKKALDIKIAEENVRKQNEAVKQSNGANGQNATPLVIGGVDIDAFLSRKNVLDMAQVLISDQESLKLLSSMAREAMSRNSPLDQQLLAVGDIFAQKLHQANPNMIKEVLKEYVPTDATSSDLAEGGEPKAKRNKSQPDEVEDEDGDDIDLD